MSQQSAASARSARSARSTSLRDGRPRNKQASQPGSSTSSIAPSDKSLTSFPSLSPESPAADRFGNDAGNALPAAPARRQPREKPRAGGSIVDNLVGREAARDALFQDMPLTRTVPGALHRADDEHIERLIARHGAVGLVRMIAEDLALRDAQISNLRRRADERERALRRVVRECGLSNLDLETRLREVENEQRANITARDGGLEDAPAISDLMSDAMQDTVAEHAYADTTTDRNGSTIRATGDGTGRTQDTGSKGTMRGWKDYLWGAGTAKKKVSRVGSVGGESAHPATAVRSHSSMDRRRTLQDDLFTPPLQRGSIRSLSRASSKSSAQADDVKASTSMASLALRLVAGGASGPRDEPRGRAVSGATGSESARAASPLSSRAAHSIRAASVSSGPKSLMAMRKAAPTPAAPASAKSQAQELWETMVGSPPGDAAARQESYVPVEMDAILPPESQPPTLTHIYNSQNHGDGEFLTDRFGYIYDQRRKKRQREAAQVARHRRKGSKNARMEMLTNGRTGISPNMLEDLPSPKWSNSTDGRPASPSSLEDRGTEDSKARRWYDYLKIATFPTELLSHTPGMGASSLEVMDAAEEQTVEPHHPEVDATRPRGITATGSGLVPTASVAAAAETTQSPVVQAASSEGGGGGSGSSGSSNSRVKEDNEPVKLLLQQLSELHDLLQRDRTVRWNDFLRKVRAERKREGEAAAAAAEARHERPAVILPETRVADGEIIGITGLGNKGKVGRAKWNEFKSLVLEGIPVAYRAKVWSECSGATALRVPGYYDGLVAQGGQDDDATVVCQIKMDIHRTLTDNIFFRKGPGVRKLNEVLLVYSRRNRDVGYCQGMNLIAANLLLITPSAEDAFWILASIVENILPHGYYDHSLMASRADQQVLRQYVSTLLPRLSAHLDSLAIELEALTFPWFLSVFTDCLSAEALFRVWDVVLCTNDGSTFLFQVALALLKLNEGNLLQCETPAAVYTYINHQMTEHAISIDGLIQASEGLRRVVRREDVEQRREDTLRAEREQLAARQHELEKKKKQTTGTTPPRVLQMKNV